MLEGQHRDQENRAEEQADDGQRPACQRPLQAVARVREGKLWSPSQVGHDMNCDDRQAGTDDRDDERTSPGRHPEQHHRKRDSEHRQHAIGRVA